MCVYMQKFLDHLTLLFQEGLCFMALDSQFIVAQA
jgi:hypothetical protein